jgi:hypothetical protein
MHSDGGHNPDPARHASDKGETYNELLKLLPELCTPVTTIVGLHHHQRGMGRH